MKIFKLSLFATLFLLMLGTIIWASLQQNLFTEFDWSGSPMWFQTTIVDFYINQFILWLGVVVLEKSHLKKLIWLILFICFGSMATAFYIGIRIFKDKPILAGEN